MTNRSVDHRDVDIPSPFKTHAMRVLTLSALLYLFLRLHSLFDGLPLFLDARILPSFGLFMMGAWLYGWKSSVYFLPGLLAATQYNAIMSATFFDSVVGHSMLVAVCAPFAFNTMQWAGIDTTIDMTGGRRVWKLIFLAGVKASAFTIALKSLVLQVYSNVDSLMTVAYKSLLYDLSGLAIFMCGLMLLFKISQMSNLSE